MSDWYAEPLMNRQQWLQDSGFLNRRIIFLDLNFWIRLKKMVADGFSELERTLAEAISGERAICAVSPSLLLEVKKRPLSDTRNQYSDLMDRFTSGLSLRQWQYIFAEEFLAVAEGRKIDRQVAYSHIMEALSHELLLQWESKPSRSERDRSVEGITQLLYQMRIRDVVDIDVPDPKVGSVSSLRGGLAALAQAEADWRSGADDSPQDIERAEFAATVRAIVPQIAAVIPDMSIRLLAELASTSEEEKRRLLDKCPSFYCNYKLLSALRTSRPRIRENDLWDLEHAVTALPYVDAFASDRGTRHLCSDVLGLDSRFDTLVTSDVQHLIDWLGAI